MITVTRNITISDTPGISYPLTVSVVSDTGCVSVPAPITIFESGIYPLQIIYADEECVGTSVVTVTAVDQKGCAGNFDLTTKNPCASFDAGDITSSPGYVFSVSPSGAGGVYNYQWSFDPSVFTLAPGTNGISSILDLELTGTPSPASTTVSVVITTPVGCTRTLSYDYVFCQPSAVNPFYTAVCKSDGSRQVIRKRLLVTPCPGTTINWGTLTWAINTPGITVTHLGGGLVTIDIQASVPATVYTIPFTVLDSQGLSTNINVSISVQDCGRDGPEIVIADSNFQLTCDQVPGTVVTYNVDDYITPNDNIDYESFSIVQQSGGFATQLNDQNQIEFTVPGAGSHYLQWLICTNNGSCANASIWTVVADCLEPPLANDDNECGACGEQKVFTPLANDEAYGGAFNPSSIQITQSPQNGTVTVTSAGEFVYTANEGYSGTDTIRYIVSNTNGMASNEATITIDVVCAGTVSNATVC